MKRPVFARIVTSMLSSLALLSSLVHADSIESNATPQSMPIAQCVNPPLFDGIAARTYDLQTETRPGQIIVLAQHADIVNDEVARFAGNVDILHPTAQIGADQATVNDSGQQVTASGNIAFVNPQIQVKSNLIALDNRQSNFVMEETEYRLNTINAQGQASQISIVQDQSLTLSDVTFTSCPLQSQDWLLKASRISVDEGDSFGQAFNTRFYVAGIPVFYLPYFAFPVTSERQSGLLFPKISSSSDNGLDITTPYYWNIAPDIDATIAPRLLTNRGLMLTSELRFLQQQNQGQINVEYLHKDDENQDEARYFVRWQQTGNLSQHLQYRIDFNDVNDANHVIDFGSDFYNRADTSLNRYFGLRYSMPNTEFNLELQDFKVLGEQTDNYRAMPRISSDSHFALSRLWHFDLRTELTHFTNQNPNLHDATRVHVTPSLTFNYHNSWSDYSAQMSYFATRYRQNVAEDSALARDVKRNIAQFKVNGHWHFERPQTLTGIGSIVTLEPQVQYLYTEFADQSDIGIYDTAPLFNTVDNLFRGQSFTGIDRITDNDQLTIALTSRFVNAQGIERASFSLGQIFYFSDSRVLTRDNELNRSSLIADFDFRISSRWFLKSQIQLASKTDNVERSSTTLEYRRDNYSLLQFNQRYVRNLSNETIHQIGLSAAYPLSDRWQWVGRWYHDQEQNRTIETYTGLQYESCCWSIRLVAQRQLLNRYQLDGQRDINNFDSGVSLQFSFKGLSSNQQNANMLLDGMFGYRQPYFTQ